MREASDRNRNGDPWDVRYTKSTDTTGIRQKRARAMQLGAAGDKFDQTRERTRLPSRCWGVQPGRGGLDRAEREDNDSKWTIGYPVYWSRRRGSTGTKRSLDYNVGS